MNGTLIQKTLLLGISSLLGFHTAVARAETVSCMGVVPADGGMERITIALNFSPNQDAHLKFINPDGTELNSWVVGPYVRQPDSSVVRYTNVSSTADETLVVQSQSTTGKDLDSSYTYVDSSLGRDVPLLCSFNAIQKPIPTPTPSPSPALPEVMITGQADGSCSPGMVHLMSKQTVSVVFKTTAAKMFLLQAPGLGIDLMIAPNGTANQTITPTKTGNFPFTCGVHGAPANEQTQGNFMVM